MKVLIDAFNPRNVIIVLLVLLALSLTTGFYFYRKSNSGDIQKKELQQAADQIGKLMVLPADETPTLATVSDPTKLSDQAFFAHAQKGDQVLIYMQSHKAILYRPSIHKIIEVAPVNGAAGSVDVAAPAR